MILPRLYAILDADLLQARALDILVFASELGAAGVTLLQYRNKQGTAQAMLEDAGRLRKAFPVAGDVRLILNDRPDLALLCDFGGVHVGRDDVSVEDARRIVRPAAWVGVSTHSPQQVAEANETRCDYIAYGPVFPTATKNNHDPTVGLAGLRIARSQTRKPLVAIGGITRENCRSVLNAGADSVAVISGLVPSTLGPGARQIAEEFLALLS